MTPVFVAGPWCDVGAEMLQAVVMLLGFQFVGELVVRLTGLPVPGPLAGMVMLVLALVAMGGPPRHLQRLTQGLLRHLTLLFLPAVAGVVTLGAVVADDWLPFLMACVGATTLSILVTAVTLRAMLRRQAQHNAPREPRP